MVDFTIFGTAAPTDLAASGDTAEVSVSTAFSVMGVSGWRCAGVRIWIPAGTTLGSGTKKAYLWVATGSTPDNLLATADFSTFVAGAWNTALFSFPVSMVAGRHYFAQVYLPTGGYGYVNGKFTGGAVVSVETTSLYAAGATEVSPGNGSYVYGTAGLAPANAFGGAWHGVDVVVEDGAGFDEVGIADAVTAVRTGLPTAIVATGSVVDPTGLSASDASTFPVGGATAFHTIQRSLFGTRISWGAVTNTIVKGPSFSLVETPLTLGLEFKTMWPVRFTSCRIYKAPNLNGNVIVRLWDRQGSGGAARDLGNVTVTWVADAGGWRDITFSAPIPLEPNVTYTLSYYSPSGDFAASTYVFYWWSDVVTPLVVLPYNSNTLTNGSAYLLGTAQTIPNVNFPSNYYIDPIVEWDSTEPVFVPDPELSYFDQWVNGRPNHPFVFGVFYADPPYLAEYAAMGVNSLIGAPITPEYVTAIKAAGMDVYPDVSIPTDGLGHASIRAMAEDPVFAALVPGYYIIDEPDQSSPYTPPSTIRTWCNSVRVFDSSRPLYMGLGRVVGMNQTFYHQPQGSNMETANELWRGWAELGDILSGDFYTMAPTYDPEDVWGIWMYPVFTRRIRTLNEGRTPIIIAVETTSETANYPAPDDVRKAMWSCIIEGCNGFELFDHRFGNATVSRDFAHMLHNPPMKAMVSATIARINSMVDAINSPDTGLVTAWTSSNTTSGPRGGTYGVPMHYTTRADDTYEYLFAMGIRPGSTTATFTIPSWAGQTLTVIDESRTVTVSGGGVLTDTFPADYTVHLYRKG